MLRFFSLSLLCVLFCLQAEEEIRVHLQTESTLQPLYLSSLYAQNTSLDSGYLRKLEEVLLYDFQHNGSSAVVAKEPEKERLLQSSSWQTTFSSSQWKGTPYVVRLAVHGKTIQSAIWNERTRTLQNLQEAALSGNLGQDRRVLHRLADSVHKLFFGKEGIAHSKILFSYESPANNGSSRHSEIWECDWDGANLQQVTHEGSSCVSPVLIPATSGRFLYVSYKHGQPKIYIATLQGGSGKRLVDLPGNQLLPAVTRQRDKIAFICDAAGRTDLFVQQLNPHTGESGKPIQLYSYPRSTQASPTFSPDGSKIAFASDKDGGIRIYVISSVPSGKRAPAKLLSKKNRENSCPSWSPDGTKLAYSAKTENIRQIWIYDFATEEEWQLTSGSSNKENPVWAHDSCHIVFNSTDGNSSELYVVNLNQPETLKITKGPGKKHYPTWGNL